MGTGRRGGGEHATRYTGVQRHKERTRVRGVGAAQESVVLGYGDAAGVVLCAILDRPIIRRSSLQEPARLRC